MALERHWLTKDPWFRIDCTVIGVTIIDTFQAAKHQAPECAKIDKMGVNDFPMYVSHDLFKRVISKEPKSVVLPSGGITTTSTTSTDQGTEVQLLASIDQGTEVQLRASLKGFRDIVAEHQITKTYQRSGNSNAGRGQLARRQCSIRATGCKERCSTECQHKVCKATLGAKLNRHAPARGIFICENHECQLKHWEDMMSVANMTCIICD